MQRTSIQLLGTFVTLTATGQPTNLRRKTRALLAYLAATNQKQSRQQLIDLFCADASDPAAVLRSLLSRIRRQVDSDLIAAEGEFISLDPRTVTVDCLQFTRNLATARSAEEFAAALALYRGEFLAGLTLKDASAFEFWLLGERNRWQTQFEGGLQKAIELLVAKGQLEAAIPYGRQWVGVNPLLELAHGYLIALYAQTGRFDAAQQQYAQCRQILATELAVEPNETLQQLFADVQNGQLRPELTIFKHRPTTIISTQFGGKKAKIVGREAEMSALKKQWQRVQQGKGVTQLIEAEAGAGKSFLLSAFTAKSRVGSTFTGSGYESAQTLPFAPWSELFEQLLTSYTADELESLTPEVRSAVAQIVPAYAHWHDGQPLPSEQLFATLTTWLASTGAKILILDNLQWMDAASLQYFHYLARRLETTSILLIGAYRPVTNNAPLATLLADLLHQKTAHVQLKPFQVEQVVELIEALWTAATPATKATIAPDLLIATGGNPLFLTEIIRELAGQDRVPDKLPLPASLLTLIQSRLRQLPTVAQQVLEGLAVLQQPATPDLVQLVAGRSENETYEALDAALSEGIIRPAEENFLTGRFDFYHDLVRDAVLEQISQLRRLLLHKRAALELKPTAQPATLAFHWRQAGNQEQEANYSVKAGDQAFEIFANEESLTFLHRALDLKPTSETWRLLGRTLDRIGRWKEAQHAFLEAERLAETAADKAAAHRFLGRLFSSQGSYDKAIAYLERSQTYYIEQDQTSNLADIDNSIAVAYYRLGKYDESIRLYERSLQWAYHLEDQWGIAAAIGNIGLVYHDMNRLEDAESKLAESLEIFREMGSRAGIANRLSNLGIIYGRQGKSDQALAAYHEALATDQELGNYLDVTRTLGNLATEYYTLGEFELALENFTGALQQAQSLPSPYFEALNLGNIGELAQEMDLFSVAKLWHLQAFRIDLAAEHRDGIVRRLYALALVNYRAGNFGLCVDQCRRALDLLQHWQTSEYVVQLWLTLARALYTLSELEEALYAANKARSAWELQALQALGTETLTLQVELAVGQGKMSQEAAIETLSEAANSIKQAEHLSIAEIGNLLWKLTNSSTYKKLAFKALEQEIRQRPHWRTRDLYKQLTGRTISPPTTKVLPSHLLPTEAVEESELLTKTARYLPQ